LVEEERGKGEEDEEPNEEASPFASSGSKETSSDSAIGALS